MPPKRSSGASAAAAAVSSASSSAGSSGSSSSSDDDGSSSSSSGSSSSSDDSGSSSDSDSDSSKSSQRSLRSNARRSASSAGDSSTNEHRQSPPVGAKSSKAAGKKSRSSAAGATSRATRSRSASSDSESATTPPKKSEAKSKSAAKKSSGGSGHKSSGGGQARKVAPKKSATAKPVAKAGAVKKPPQQQILSENDSDSDFGDFSLPNLAAKAKKNASSAAGTASSSASNTPKPQASTPTPATPPAPPTSHSSKSQSAKTSKGGAGSGAGAATGNSKYRSIFSASSGSDSDVAASKSTSKKKSSASQRRSPSPPKLTPQKKSSTASKAPSASDSRSKVSSSRKAAAASKAAAAAAAAATAAASKASKTRSSSVSSAGSSSSLASKLSRSSSDDDSSSDSEVIITKKHQKTTAAATAAAAAAAAAASSAASRQRSKKVLQAPVRKKAEKSSSNKRKGPAATASSAAAAANSTDSEGGKVARPTTRQTRGAAPRRSKHITGRLADTDTDSDAGGGGAGGGGGGGGAGPSGAGASSAHPGGHSQSEGGSSPRKKSSGGASSRNGGGGANSGQGSFMGVYGRVNLPPVRRDLDGLSPIETRKCPVPGCDSSGHLGGRLDRHFLVESCPVYHNSNRKQCRDFRQESNKRNTARKRALTAMAAKSPMQSLTSEQRKHLRHVKDARSQCRPLDQLSTEHVEEPAEDRELDLKPYASDWDLKLFREAQALASEDLEQSLKGLPDTKATRYVEMGKSEMEVWYQSPYPEEFNSLPRLYICEFCLKYMKSRSVLARHAAKCVWKHPPGDEIYRKDKLSVFEICGKRYKQYCQNLCLLAKFFLDHKTLYFDVEPFLFYVMTTADSEGCHIVGYFSKEKNSTQNFNVSCILTLPPYQRQGFGRLLIDFSYLLSRVENKVGSPEKPLSDLGLITYRAYWKDVLLDFICNFPEKEISIKTFSEEMGINSYDLISTLQYLGMIKYWKGQHVILKKEDVIEEYLAKSRNRSKAHSRQIHANALKWKPYEPTAKERRQAEQIKKSQEERQKKR